MKTITLTRGYFAMVDDNDLEFLSQFKWYAVKPSKKSKMVYAAHNSGRGGKSKYILMHRLITAALKGEQVDHRDRNGLNNQRDNLRHATASENNSNTKLSVRNTSGFRGVSWSSAMKKWRSEVGYQNGVKVIGYFDDPKEAAFARDAAALSLFGEFASLNFSVP